MNKRTNEEEIINKEENPSGREDAGIKRLEPKLYLCATPIGNLKDVTERVLEALKCADVIYCEDTRNTAQLLNMLGIKGKKLAAAHMHNEEQQARQIAENVRGGMVAAYVSDAGMPCISDPGERIVQHFIEEGIPFEVLPGASAALTAAILSGLGTRRIYFAGFLPRENSERTEFLAEIAKVRATIVVYESPFRVADTLSELMNLLGNRKAAVCRELTKLHEQTVRGDLASLAQKYAEEAPRGECVIVVSGEASGEEQKESMDDMLKRLLSSGMSAKDAAKQAALLLDVPKSTAYARANEIKQQLKND